MNALRLHSLTATLVALLVSACGGGAEDNSSDGSTSDELARSASANGVVVVGDSVRAQSVLLSLARGVVAVNGVAGSPGCAGGGHAVFTASANGGNLFNGAPDAGEAYTIQFVNCRSSTGSATANGTLSLTVLSASGENYAVTTSSDVFVTMPDRTLRLNGSSTITHTEQTSGGVQTITDRWVSPSMSIRSARNSRFTTLSLTDVDWTETTVTTTSGGSASSSQGRVTMGYDGWLGRWSATVTTNGPVSFNINGLPVGGQWLITLPRDLVVLTIASNVATAALDLGRNSSIERTLTWPLLVLLNAAD